ncbi:MAG: hypothetical protein IT328_05475 [Caldilineaceae bacterium]|nr:hypothetical protein [Caldilineaceae bacterium]
MANPSRGTLPLTRKELYDLAAHCRTYAQELARHEQTRVNLKHCHEFNSWLAKLKSYDLLARPLATLQAARPVARWQVMVLAGVVGLILLLVLPGRVDRALSTAIVYGFFLLLIIFYFVPERLYGTTIELLEAKVLRVVDALDELLHNAELGLTEAAYFRVKENLEAARHELRQQIDLAHRRF